MKAAIYARKSTDDNDRNEENKSITRQVERARAYAQSKDWTVDDEHVFIDDGISGAEFIKRPGLIRMMTRLKEFNVVVVSEISRLGRDTVRTPVVIDDIRTAGVRIFYYLTDDEEKADTPEQQVMVSLKSFGAAMERAKIAERTRDALSRKAEKGQCPGGACYGYDTVRVYATGVNGEQTASHSDWKINEDQAEIVRGIFRMYADGRGHTVITKALNGDPKYHALNMKYFHGQTPAAPQHGEQGTGSWAPSTIRCMLYRTRYAGTIPYGQYRNVRNGGRTGKCVKQEKFIAVERPDLRIIDSTLWKKVQTRLKAVRETYIRDNNGDWWGRPETGRESKYLLSGLARCGCEKKDGHVCGASIALTIGGQSQSHYYYGCSYHQNRGRTVCSNDHRERMTVMDDLVLSEVEGKVLTPEAVDVVVQEAVREYESLMRQKPQQLPLLETELRKIQKELDRFMNLIANGKGTDRLLEEARKRETRVKTLRVEIERYRLPTRLAELDLHRVRKQARLQAERYRDLVRSDVPVARQVLRKLLRDKRGEFSPLMFIPVMRDGRKTFEVRGSVNTAPLFDKNGTEERT